MPGFPIQSESDPEVPRIRIQLFLSCLQPGTLNREVLREENGVVVN